MTPHISVPLICLLMAVPTVAADEGKRPGKTVVDEVCAKCHLEGAKGAPRIGDRDAWIQRLKGGLDALVLSAIRGHGGMPPRGGHAEFTDGEIRGAILYMFDPQALARIAATPSAAPVKADPNTAVVDGMEIRFGLVSAERLRKFPKDSPEARMHGGVPSGSGHYHVNVSLSDAVTHAAIAGAAVEVEVIQAGSETQTKVLELVRQLKPPSYGHYLRLNPKAPATVTVRVRKPGTERTVEARFRPTPD